LLFLLFFGGVPSGIFPKFWKNGLKANHTCYLAGDWHPVWNMDDPAGNASCPRDQIQPNQLSTFVGTPVKKREDL
jgi:hypothetical protein